MYRNIFQQVVDQLCLTDSHVVEHGTAGIPVAQLVKIVIHEKDMEIERLKRGIM